LLGISSFSILKTWFRKSTTVLLLAHPRTQKRLGELALNEWTASLPGVKIVDAVGCFGFLALLDGAVLVFADSGGVQQESCIHQVLSVTLCDNTE
jgi:UDP-N-acetylglucosamine 2-epimerase (non-hydrolysing)